MGYTATGEVTFFDIEEYHVQKQVITAAVFEDARKIEWVTEHYSTGVDKESLAIFNTREAALSYVRGEFGKQKEEVIWTSEQ